MAVEEMLQEGKAEEEESEILVVKVAQLATGRKKKKGKWNK